MGSSATGHDMYGPYQQNGSGASCCNDKDCRPVTMCTLPDGKEGYIYIPIDDQGKLMSEVPGQCVPIPWSRVIEQPSHDGQNHLCAPSPYDKNHPEVIPFIYCFIRGGGF
jgi:putative hemolysin